MKEKSYNLRISPGKEKKAPSTCNDTSMHSLSEQSSSKSTKQPASYSSTSVKPKSYDLTVSPDREKKHHQNAMMYMCIYSQSKVFQNQGSNQPDILHIV